MARVLSTAFLVALLAATAAAFALTQRAKLELSPIYKTSIPRTIISPGITVANIDFRLRNREHLTVWMTYKGERVVTIVPGQSYKAGPVKLVFTGITETGFTLPDGIYVPVVQVGSHRTFTLPNQIRIDTKPPVLHFPHRMHRVISPDGDGRKDSFVVHYTVSEPAHGILLVDGKRFERTRSKARAGVLNWGGKLNGRPAKLGNHVLSISAEDEAGNKTKPFPFAVVTIRYVKLGRTEIHVAPGRRLAVLVLTDAREVRWLLAGGRGTSVASSPTRTLRIRAPKRAGTYHLYVTARGHTAVATVTVG